MRCQLYQEAQAKKKAVATEEIDGLAAAVTRAKLGADVLAQAAAWIATKLGARSVKQLETEDIEGALSPAHRLGFETSGASLRAPLCLAAFGSSWLPLSLGGGLAELIKSLGLLKVPSRDLRRSLEEAAGVRAQPTNRGCYSIYSVSCSSWTAPGPARDLARGFHGRRIHCKRSLERPKEATLGHAELSAAFEGTRSTQTGYSRELT